MSYVLASLFPALNRKWATETEKQDIGHKQRLIRTMRGATAQSVTSIVSVAVACNTWPRFKSVCVQNYNAIVINVISAVIKCLRLTINRITISALSFFFIPTPPSRNIKSSKVLNSMSTNYPFVCVKTLKTPFRAMRYYNSQFHAQI